jgi:hypothetical protein
MPPVIPILFIVKILIFEIRCTTNAKILQNESK